MPTLTSHSLKSKTPHGLFWSFFERVGQQGIQFVISIILARRYFSRGCHRMEPYRSYFPHAELLLAETERIVNRVVTLPTGVGVSVEDISRVCELIRFVVANGSEISKALEHRHLLQSRRK